MDPRTVKPRRSLALIVGSVAIAVAVVAFILFAIWESGRGIKEARMTGTIVTKEFVSSPERQITLTRQGAVNARETDGDYIITVEVVMPDGTKKPFNVWLSKQRYEAVKEGDSFDVGPYLVK